MFWKKLPDALIISRRTFKTQNRKSILKSFCTNRIRSYKKMYEGPKNHFVIRWYISGNHSCSTNKIWVVFDFLYVVTKLFPPALDIFWAIFCSPNLYHSMLCSPNLGTDFTRYKMGTAAAIIVAGIFTSCYQWKLFFSWILTSY